MHHGQPYNGLEKHTNNQMITYQRPNTSQPTFKLVNQRNKMYDTAQLVDSGYRSGAQQDREVSLF
jgi:hypothetical protein